MAFSTAIGDAILDHISGEATWSAPSTIYMSVHTGDPGANGANEADDIARQEIAVGASSAKSAANTSEETFEQSGGTEQTITHVGLWAHETSTDEANFIMGGELDDSKVIDDGDSLVLAIGDATFTVT